MDLLAHEQTGPPKGSVACRVAYRLAHYADSLYQGIQLQKASPEYQTARAIIQAKRKTVQPHLPLLWHQLTLSDDFNFREVKLFIFAGTCQPHLTYQIMHMRLLSGCLHSDKREVVSGCLL